MLRLLASVAVVLGVLAGVCELALRAAGAAPRTPGWLSEIVPDGWTGFRLRPGVAGPEAFVTNDLGMHAPRSYTLAPPPLSLRIAVLGSSVVYGMATPLEDTIPGVVERELQAAGRRAEVLNFGTQQYSLVNVSAQLQAYVHQFQPDVVVVVVDLQVGLVRWPNVHPRPTRAANDTRGFWEALWQRGAEKSALLALFDEPRTARRWTRRATGLRLEPRAPATPRPKARARPARPAVPPGALRPTASTPEERRAYEERRERDLAAPMAAMAAFCDERSIALYLVTPYGPYFDLTEDELEDMSVEHFLEEAARVHGSPREALGAEVELITRVTRRVAARGSARVIDMLEASRRSSPGTSSDFTEDGVHLSLAGNATLGRLIAERILQDLEQRAGGGD